MNIFEQSRLLDAQHKPRYLFRAASGYSRGMNTMSEIDPMAAHGSVYREDLASIPMNNAKAMLRAHLGWNYNVRSEFSSWSVSLLWVLVHAVSKTTNFKKRRAEDANKIFVYVLDTRRIADSRIHRSKDLIPIFGLGDIAYIENYSQGEYLIHGILRDIDGFQAVSLAQLINVGLFVWFTGLQPDAGNYELHNRSQSLRREYSGHTWPLGPRVTPNYRALGACFGIYWEAFMTLAFISVHDGIAEADQLANWLYLFRTLIEKQFLDEERQNAEKEEAEEDVADLLGGLTVNDSSDPIAGRAYPAMNPLPPQQLSKGKAAATAAVPGSVHDGAAKKSSSTTRKLAKAKQMPPTSSSESQRKLDTDTSSLAGSSSKLSAASTATTNVAEADTENVIYAGVRGIA
ncbi:hypothetical protein LTR17_013738 [Elasticomyces elasticus]|nr:hypothetical protein LTR17_013738 [Elasticomyces elasticus]